MLKQIKYNRLKTDFENQLENWEEFSFTSQTICYSYKLEILAYSSKVDYKFQLNFYKLKNIGLGKGLTNSEIITMIESKFNKEKYELEVVW